MVKLGKDTCIEFYRLFEQKGDFCGLPEGLLREVKDYMKLIQKMSAISGLEDGKLYRNLDFTTLRPLTNFPEGSTKEETIVKILKELKKGRTPTQKAVNIYLGIKPKPRKIRVKPDILPLRDTLTIDAKNDLIPKILSLDEMAIIIDVMQKEGLNNEYEALSRVIKWAAEKIRR